MKFTYDWVMIMIVNVQPVLKYFVFDYACQVDNFVSFEDAADDMSDVNLGMAYAGATRYNVPSTQQRVRFYTVLYVFPCLQTENRCCLHLEQCVNYIFCLFCME